MMGQLIQSFEITSDLMSSPQDKPTGCFVTDSLEQKMFEQFFIVGVPPDSPSNDPKILAMYPSTQYKQTDDDFARIIQRCFPSKFTTIREEDPLLMEEFVFFEGTPNDRIYGVCIHMKASANSTPFFATRTNRNWPFCLCILTKMPFLSAHFEFLSFLCFAFCGKIATGLKSKERQPALVKGFCHPSLVLDHTTPAIAVWPKLHAPMLLIDSLTHYLTLPVVNQETAFVDNRLGWDLHIPVNLSKRQCMSYPAMDTLFSCFDVPSIVQLYTSMILARKVLFVSGNPTKGALSVIALESLMSPFQSSTQIIPVVSLQDQSLLDSVKPYIAGSSLRNSTADVIADADTGTVVFAKEIPRIPNEEGLLRKLRMLIDSRREEVTSPFMNTKSFFGRGERNPDYDTFVNKASVFTLPHSYLQQHYQRYIFSPHLIDSIREVFAVHVPLPLSDKLAPCIAHHVEKSKQALNKDMFLERCTSDETTFYTHFAATEIFTDFVSRSEDEVIEEPQRSGNPSILRSPTKPLSPFRRDREGDL